MANDIDGAVTTIRQLLGEDPQAVWSKGSLENKLLQMGVYSNTRRLGVILQAMAACNVLALRGDQLRYKEPESGYTKEQMDAAIASYVEKVDRLKESLHQAAKDFQAKDAELAQLRKTNGRVIGVEVKANGQRVKKVTGVFHSKFESILTLAKARKNIFLYGPTGSGKSFVCRQVATSLHIPYSYVSCTSGMSEGVLGGKLLPIGKQGSFDYVVSEFVRCFESGGLFLLDEIDAADANVLLFINNALANGEMTLNNRPKKPVANKHQNFVCVAAANTLGTNADRMYSARNKLDQSTLDRFAIGKVFIDYDRELERQLCPDNELLERCWKIREGIMDNRLERAMSTRFIQDAYDMKANFGWTYEQLDETYFMGWREDEVNKVKRYL